ncbi:MAG: 50S ribosomal protein L17 [Clostridia bacterium]|nr:50S ribosomal protein L17 [Clostridia bacterium]MDY5263770.1 50S ribosomal protein L17 [Eubacteriales bacterium]
MAGYRKLSKPTDLRMAILKNQVSEFLWFGTLNTTLDRAKEVRKLAEKYITLAINTYEDTITVTKNKKNLKGETVAVEFKNDGAMKLAARRKLMASLVDLQEIKGEKESKSAYKARTAEVAHPLVEKIFNEYAPKYAERAKELGQGGGYTRILRVENRLGDNAEMVILQLV